MSHRIRRKWSIEQGPGTVRGRALAHVPTRALSTYSVRVADQNRLGELPSTNHRRYYGLNRQPTT